MHVCSQIGPASKIRWPCRNSTTKSWQLWSWRSDRTIATTWRWCRSSCTKRPCFAPLASTTSWFLHASRKLTPTLTSQLSIKSCFPWNRWLRWRPRRLERVSGGGRGEGGVGKLRSGWDDEKESEGDEGLLCLSVQGGEPWHGLVICSV